ncbi:MAG: L-threonylcarbamoyladenylate synthase, partial [Halobacteriales archaeon]|nr:L-threonylcarbamoyladenylate synthase [Halobacteriales archaeon]
ARLTPLARRLAAQFLPGPLTLVLPPAPGVPDELRGGERGLGVRVPAHPVARELARRFGPITCTSANLHSAKDPRTAAEARQHLGGAASLYLEAGPCTGAPSTVVDLTASPPRIVREGALPRKELEPWLGMSTSTT